MKLREIYFIYFRGNLAHYQPIISVQLSQKFYNHQNKQPRQLNKNEMAKYHIN